jgi:uncharacterized metal-binding protein YceD (DUF177 family)
VKKRGSYAVRISGVGEGDHNFSFELDKEFFALFDHSEITRGEVSAEILMNKKAGVISLHFTLSGKVEVVCDRCLEEFMMDVASTQTIFVKVGDNPGEIEDDVLIIGRDDHEVEVGQFLYEFVVLALPYQKVHPENMQGNSSCNQEMLKRLNAHQTVEADKEEKTDPRWDALKGIIEKNE